jgi:hypothetical protein
MGELKPFFSACACMTRHMSTPLFRSRDMGNMALCFAMRDFRPLPQHVSGSVVARGDGFALAHIEVGTTGCGADMDVSRRFLSAV